MISLKERVKIQQAALDGKMLKFKNKKGEVKWILSSNSLLMDFNFRAYDYEIVMRKIWVIYCENQIHAFDKYSNAKTFNDQVLESTGDILVMQEILNDENS